MTLVARALMLVPVAVVSSESVLAFFGHTCPSRPKSMGMNSTLIATFARWSSQKTRQGYPAPGGIAPGSSQVQDRVDQMAQHAEHASPQAGGGRPVSAETQGGARGRSDSDTDHGAVPVLAGRIALRRASSRAAHKGLLGRLGPGLITGASDDDPSGIATYSQTGAQFGYAMCWSHAVLLPADGGDPRDQRAHGPHQRARGLPVTFARTIRACCST